MVLSFTTETGSSYELDIDNSKIRRCSGPAVPTPRQGADGDWKTYEQISEPTIGSRLVIVWTTRSDHIDECTMTSQIVSIDEIAGIEAS